MRRAQIEIAKPCIITFFESQKQKVYTLDQLDSLLAKQREEWKLGKSMTVHKFTAFLVKETKLSEQPLPFPYRKTIRYFWGAPPLYELAMSLRPTGYLSHYSALHYHRLVPEKPITTVYVNDEQEAKGGKRGTLTQARIDAAFKRPVRTSRNCVQYGGITLCLLNGMNTDMLGVVKEYLPDLSMPLLVTSIERSLIDSVVRPVYAGGVATVLNAYKHAVGNVSIQNMVKMLKQLKYVYPYHQAIGFYLDYCGGYDDTVIGLFRKFPMKYDFYLDYQMEKTNYTKTWRLYYPSYL
ncbi:MAG: Transcriptional regulator, predicted component of viral defense system [Chloroflexi bacterium AL-W]|nr:Transcriptional regulator, predicted component of viral defense system [Chloroflexi bacterium AL-N1]NOK71057.1 Transcriptional regulator, predicted component of viral defense system [Chloroflexi bacterium AL-N10]NOK72721.1 Transcriptional regulator, predicted component of viral defense system [Chloroflexi bacterium AL-N5]NOK79191.1 Transcriptional regulator, predicted component of viral defense system [Chloroflexi bacterium AL-W]NOK87107.1 Transcriptional regulator, predicted component of vi